MLAEVEARYTAGALAQDQYEVELRRARIKRLSKKTINNHLAAVGQVFGHARDDLGLAVENPCYKKRFSKRVIQNDPDRRIRRLDDSDMETLFRSPLFTGCRSAKLRWRRGKLILRDQLYWVVLLEAYDGLRLEEACQLAVEDIRPFFGVPWIEIHNLKGKNTKNISSNRCVPLHDYLIQLGFLDYIEERRRAKGHRLFPGLKRDGRGKLGGYLSKQYTNYRRRIGLDADGKDGHALRHAFDTYLHNEHVPTIRLSELMGHQRKGETAGTYFHGSRPALLWEAINRLTYGFKVAVVNGEPQLVRDQDPSWTIPAQIAYLRHQRLLEGGPDVTSSPLLLPSPNKG